MSLLKIFILCQILFSIQCISTNRERTVLNGSYEMVGERCGLRRCSESFKDGYFRYENFPEFYINFTDIPYRRNCKYNCYKRNQVNYLEDYRRR